MSEKVAHYRIGNVTRMQLPPRSLSTGSDDTAMQYGSTLVQKPPLAKVLPLTAPKKKEDAPQL